MPQDAAALNIGAGANRSGDMSRRAGVVQCRLVGVDPSARIHAQLAGRRAVSAELEQFAIGHAGEFDLAFSVFVLEHVADPDGFATPCCAVLKPGGTLMGLTVNKWHYFGFTTWAATRFGFASGCCARSRAATSRLPLPD